MKIIYILLTKSDTALSRLVRLVTAARYTHVSIAFDESLRTVYSSTRKNGRTLFPAGPCRNCPAVSRGICRTCRKAARRPREEDAMNEERLDGSAIVHNDLPWQGLHKYVLSLRDAVRTSGPTSASPGCGVRGRGLGSFLR